MSKKVTIEITENGWQTTVELNGKTFVEKYERTSTGARSVEGDFDSVAEMSDELVSELTGLSIYNIMAALYEHE